MQEVKPKRKTKVQLESQPLVVVLDTREKDFTKKLFTEQIDAHPEWNLSLEIKAIPAGDIGIAFRNGEGELQYVVILEKKTFDDLYSTIRGVKREHESQVLRGDYRNQAEALVKVATYCTGYMVVGPMKVRWDQAKGCVAQASVSVCKALARINLAYGDIHKIFLAPDHESVPFTIFHACDVLREEGIIEQLITGDLGAAEKIEPPIISLTGDPSKRDRLSSISDEDFLRFENTLHSVLRNRQAIEEKEVIRRGAILKADDPDKSFKIMLTCVKGLTVENFAQGIKPNFPTMMDFYLALEKDGPAALKVVEGWKKQRRDTIFRLLTGKDPKDYPPDSDEKRKATRSVDKKKETKRKKTMKTQIQDDVLFIKDEEGDLE